MKCVFLVSELLGIVSAAPLMLNLSTWVLLQAVQIVGVDF